MEGELVKCRTFNANNVMIMPWERPNPFMPLVGQDNASYKRHLLEHNATLDIESPKRPAVLSKIVCTIGDKSSEPDIFGRMIKNGMAIVRIDMGIGDREQHLNQIKKSRDAIMEYSSAVQRVKPIAIAAELCGPQILTGAFQEVDKVILEDGDTINLTTHPGFDVKGSKSCVYIDHKELPYVLKPKDKILLDCGRIMLSVRGCYDSEVVCEVLAGGTLKSYADVTVLDVPLNIPVLTEKDKRDIDVLVAEQVDMIIIPHIEDKSNIDEIKKQIGVRNTNIQIVAKIDSKLGYRNFKNIVDEVDGFIIDRGKLSIEISTEKVMQAQKTMVAIANMAGKPVYGTYEYLNSMTTNNCPTFAESTDIINAIIDGLDGIILKEETARGDYPALTVRTLATLCREAEAQSWQREIWSSLNEMATPPQDPAQAVMISAVEAANKASATAIIIATTSGTSAKYLAKYRPRCPIIAVTRYGSVARKLQLYRGVQPLHYIVAPNPNWCLDVDLRLQFGINTGKMDGIIKPGDPLVLVSGWRQGAGFTNNVRIVYASQEEPWILPYSPVVAP